MCCHVRDCARRGRNWLVLVAAVATLAATPQAQQPDPTDDMVALAQKPWSGDLDAMIKRRMIRVLVPPSKTHYFIDKGVQRGITYDALKQFEDELNRQHKTGNLRVHVVFIPTSRDQLQQALLEGHGDIVAANVTITDERQDLVDFVAPTFTNVKEVGAIGVMQVMPATGKDMKVGDISRLEPNIHAGVKYIRFVIDQYYKDEPMDRLNKALFAFASYNAGPGRLRQLRAEARRQGLDPNVWFNNVERVAAARIGRETVQYVSNIYKYYVAYQLAWAERESRKAG